MTDTKTNDSSTEVESTDKTSQTTTPITSKNGLKQRSSLEDRLARAKGQSSKKDEDVKDQGESDATNIADESGEGKEKSEPSLSLDDFKGKAAEALEKGDLKTLAKLLGKDAKLVDASNEKYSVLRKKADKLDSIEGKLKSENERLVNLGKELRAEFQTPREAARAYKNGKFGKAAEALQQWFGDDFATITRNIAREVAGLSDEEKDFLKRKAALEEKEAELTKKETTSKKTQTEAQQRQQAVKVLTAKCQGHDVLKLKDGAELVLRALEEAYDPDLGSSRLNIKQAADKVLEEKLEAARMLGVDVGKVASKKDKKATEKKTPDPVYTKGLESIKEGKFKKPAPLEARLEAARRLTAKSRIN